jgi:alpha-D-xyloside xylohydrolase
VEYFEGTNFEKSAGKEIDAKVDHNWPGPPLTQPPAQLKSLDYFSARWEGFVTAPEDGEYEIGVEIDDGARLWIDGKLVAEDWSNNTPRYRFGKVVLHKEHKADLKIEYYNGTGQRVLRLSWRTPSELEALRNAKPALDNSYATYLPKSAAWFDFWTNARYDGGQKVTGHYALNRFPLYVRAGSIVPLGPVVQYATEKLDAPYEIRVYPGADARFTVYEDDNETYNYEKGQYAAYELTWNDAAKTLTVGDRQGSFPGMMASRTLSIELASQDANAGIGEGSANVKTVTYSGKKIEVRFDAK